LNGLQRSSKINLGLFGSNKSFPPARAFFLPMK
jgi:hypothetical protein